MGRMLFNDGDNDDDEEDVILDTAETGPSFLEELRWALKVIHKELKILKNIKIDDKNYKIIRNLHKNQKTVRLHERTTVYVKITRGLRQGFGMSPNLLNLHSEIILRELEEVPERLKLKGTLLNNLRYAVDTVLIAAQFRTSM